MSSDEPCSSVGNEDTELAQVLNQAWRLPLIDPAEAGRLAGLAQCLALEKSDELSVAKAQLVLALLDARQLKPDVAEQTLQAVSLVFERHGDRLSLLRVLLVTTIIRHMRGEWAVAAAECQTKLAEFERHAEPCDQALFFNQMSMVTWLSGNLVDAMRYSFRGLSIARQFKLYDLQAVTLINLGIAIDLHGNGDEALKYLEQARDLTVQHGLDALTNWMLGFLVSCQLSNGQHEAAFATISCILGSIEGAEQAQQFSNTYTWALAAQYFAEQKEWTSADNALNKARSSVESERDIVTQFQFDYVEGKVELGLGRAQQALIAFERAAQLLGHAPLVPPHLESSLYSGLASCHELLGNWQLAYQMLTRHKASLERLNSIAVRARADTAQVYEELAEAERQRDQARLHQAELERERAYTDPLTHLPNREGLRQEGELLLADGRSLAVLMLTINRFKAINDALGFSYGDAVLIETGRRLATIAGTQVGRVHANQFCMLWQEPNQADAESLRAQLDQLFAMPVSVDEQLIDVELSIGAAIAPQHGQNMIQLMRNAEIALRGTRKHHEGWTLYARSLESSRRADLGLLSSLRQAVSNKELQLYLQPKIRLSDGQVSSAEALLRWQHPTRGLVPPAEFVPFAEQTGCISHLTFWVLREAMRLTVAWQAKEQPLQISVNLSIHDLHRDDFVPRILGLLAESGARSEDIRLEVTESGVMDDPERVLEVLKSLTESGFSIAIDDFGTGQASLAYLQKMPVVELKIDRAFVTGVDLGSEGEALLDTIILLGHRLGLSVVAEGAESACEWALLNRLGCDYSQGWFAAKAMPVAEFSEWRENNVPFLPAVNSAKI